MNNKKKNKITEKDIKDLLADLEKIAPPTRLDGVYIPSGFELKKLIDELRRK